MSTFKKITLFSFVLFSLVSFAQQDPQYSQYMFNQLTLNPAYAGSKDLLSAAIFYRQQWVGIDGAPETQTLSIHSPLKKKKVGLGFSVIRDVIGPKKSIGFLGSYSYSIKVNNGKLAFGLRGGLYNYVFNWKAIDYKDNVEERSITENHWVPSADAGFYYYTNSMYLGVSATHLIPNRKITKSSDSLGGDAVLSRHFFITLGKAWSFSDKLVFNPSLVVKKAKGSPISYDLNASFMLDQRLWVGVSGRTSISSFYGIVVYTQIKVSDKFKVGFAYDIGLNQIGQNKISKHTYEIMIGYDLNVFKSKMASPRYL